MLAAALGLAACGSFEDPAIVIDLRALAVVVDPPEQVVPFDPDDPMALPELAPFEVCTLVADPGAVRGLAWSLTVCPRTTSLRCNPERPSFVAAEGHVDDPDVTATPTRMCGTVPAGGALLGVIRDQIEHDNLQGFGGIDINLSLKITPDGARADEAVYAGKAARFSAKLPAERVANQNPTLARIEVDFLGDPAAPFPVPLGRCVDQVAPITLPVGRSIHLVPIEPPGAREEYVVPTFEGGSRRFTENLSYQWLAGGGDWTRSNTGGTRDNAGNPPPLDTAWETPTTARLAEDGVTLPVDIPLWIVQRDERGGTAWFEACVRVVP